MCGSHAEPPHQQFFIYDPVKQFCHRLYDLAGGRCILFQIDRAMGMLWNLSSVTVCFDFSMIPFLQIRIFQIVNIISHCQDNLIGDESFIYQIQHQQIRHLPRYQPCLLKRIRALQHLTGTDAAALRLVCLNISNGTRFPAPCMIDQKLCVDAEQSIQKVFIMIICRFSQRTAGDIAHSKEPALFQLPGISSPDPPEVGERTMPPQLLPVGDFIQFGNTHAVLICRDMLCPDIHSHFTEIQIGTNSRGGSNAYSIKYIADHLYSQFPGSHLICPEIRCSINEHLIYGVNMDIFRSDILKVYLINLTTDLHIMCHLWRSDHIIHCQRRILFQLRVLAGRTAKLMPRCSLTAQCVDFPDFLHYFKQSRPARDSIGLERRRDRKTDCFLRPALIRYHQICCHRVQPPLHTLYRGIK